MIVGCDHVRKDNDQSKQRDQHRGRKPGNRTLSFWSRGLGVHYSRPVSKSRIRLSFTICSTSAIVLPAQTAALEIRTIPITNGTSRFLTAATVSAPIPGQPSIVSTMTEPPT